MERFVVESFCKYFEGTYLRYKKAKKKHKEQQALRS